MSTNFDGDLTRLGLKATNHEDAAREIAQKLRNVGIDVVDGLDPEEAVDRLPLSYVTRSFNSDTLIIGSRSDQHYDCIEKATQSRYPGKYYLAGDKGDHIWYDEGGHQWEGSFAAKIRPSSKNTARVSLFCQKSGGSGRIVRAGEFVYDITTETLTYEEVKGARPGVHPTLHYQYDGESTICFQGPHSLAEGKVYTFGTGSSEALDAVVRRAAIYDKETTGVELKSSFRSVYLRVSDLPNSRNLKPLEERVTVAGDMDKTLLGDSISVDPLPKEQMQEACSTLRELLDNKKEGRDYRLKDVRVSYVMVMTIPLKGQRKPIGHIVLGATDGAHYEYCEFAIARTSASFEITDVYIRVKEEEKTEFRRCCGDLMRQVTTMLYNLKIIKTSLENARNLKNPYAINAMQEAEETGGSAALPAYKLRAVASLRFGSDFVERCYRMGYDNLANDVCTALAPTRTWNRITSMADLFPGYTEGAKSIYTCFGMPKAWGKAVFDRCIEANGIGFSVSNLYNSLLSLRMAWELEGALTKGKPSEMSVPDRALEYADIWAAHLDRFGLNAGRTTDLKQHFLFAAYPDNPIERAAALRAYHRMVKKAIKAAPTNSIYNTNFYLMETFQAYCQLKAININPEEHGVLYEYGLPENDPTAVAEMIRRRCEAAQEVVNSYRAIIDEKNHQEQEARFAAHRKDVKWFECSDKTVSKEYIFKLPTKLYGMDESFSLESEGTKQCNCLFGSYLSRLANGEYYVVCMRRRGYPDDSVVSIGINRNYVVDQTYATRDCPITREQGEAIRRWVAEVSPKFGGKLKLAPHPAGWYH
jgi:hypothetical protein